MIRIISWEIRLPIGKTTSNCPKKKFKIRNQLNFYLLRVRPSRIYFLIFRFLIQIEPKKNLHLACELTLNWFFFWSVDFALKQNFLVSFCSWHFVVSRGPCEKRAEKWKLKNCKILYQKLTDFAKLNYRHRASVRTKTDFYIKPIRIY